jgi:C_GCAxxG_C_C family probable redox protein
MIYRGELRFNCCESTLMMVNEKHPLPGFGEDILRVASNFGGGVAGWGDMCGAASGAAMVIGLLYGTEGTETLKVYDEMRLRERNMTQRFLQSFRERWGYVSCRGLLGCEGCSPEERFKRYNELKEHGLTHCDEFVEWAAKKTLEMIAEESHRVPN